MCQWYPNDYQASKMGCNMQTLAICTAHCSSAGCLLLMQVIIIVFLYVSVSIPNSTQEISYKTNLLLIAAECVVTISQCGGTTKRMKTARGNASEVKTINYFKRIAMNVPL